MSRNRVVEILGMKDEVHILCPVYGEEFNILILPLMLGQAAILILKDRCCNGYGREEADLRKKTYEIKRENMDKFGSMT